MLAGSAAYAYAETFGWHQGLDAKFKSARAFYGIVICSTVVGIALDCAKISPVKALFYTAVINGLLAPFLLVGVLLGRHGSKNHARPAKPPFECRLSFPSDFVDVRELAIWDVRVLKIQRISEESWRSYFDAVSVRGQRGDKISRRAADSLVQVASAHLVNALGAYFAKVN